MKILAMGALINCVELKENTDNCAAMASLAANLPASVGARERERTQVRGMALFPKCFAPEFLARLLIRCTRSFGHQLQGDRPDQCEEEPVTPALTRHGDILERRRNSDSSALVVAPTAQPVAPLAAHGTEGEELMSHAEGADLVLGGHCALLLGLLIRVHESNRCVTHGRVGRHPLGCTDSWIASFHGVGGVQ